MDDERYPIFIKASEDGMILCQNLFGLRFYLLGELALRQLSSAIPSANQQDA